MTLMFDFLSRLPLAPVSFVCEKCEVSVRDDWYTGIFDTYLLDYRQTFFVMKMARGNLTRATHVRPVSLSLHIITPLSRVLHLCSINSCFIFPEIRHPHFISSQISLLFLFVFTGDANLSGKYDFIRVDLQPPEQYKSVSIPL